MGGAGAIPPLSFLPRSDSRRMSAEGRAKGANGYVMVVSSDVATTRIGA